HSPLTIPELQNDCLCYLQYNGKPVKAARLFAGYEHDEGLKRIAAHFNSDVTQFSRIVPDPAIIAKLRGITSRKSFAEQDLSLFESSAEAYHSLMLDIIHRQQASTRLILKGDTVRKIFVDGGFSKNPLFMRLLAESFPQMEVYAASVAQASAIGTAMAVRRHWNTKPGPENIIKLERPVI
ncbi:MAG TPA: FGGY-family carbohydrate kinase, partial [Mucilaginibacter sp.]|nr:FGGY-family carbohydrate kinase [Mucilaginibacter sp.]